MEDEEVDEKEMVEGDGAEHDLTRDEIDFRVSFSFCLGYSGMLLD